MPLGFNITNNMYRIVRWINSTSWNVGQVKMIYCLEMLISTSDSSCTFDDNSDRGCRYETRTDSDGLMWESVYEMEILGYKRNRCMLYSQLS